VQAMQPVASPSAYQMSFSSCTPSIVGPRVLVLMFPSVSGKKGLYPLDQKTHT